MLSGCKHSRNLDSSDSKRLSKLVHRYTRYLHCTPLALLRMQVQVYTSCVANHRLPHLTRIRWRRLTQHPRHVFNRVCPRTLFLRFLVTYVLRYPNRVPTPTLNSTNQFDRNKNYILRIRLGTLPALRISCRRFFPVADYLVAGSSLDTRAPLLYDTTERLNGCLERVVAAKVADCAS